MRLRSTGPDLHQYVITGVIEDSPAAKAKLQEGDRLVEIGGKSPQSLSLGEILDILKRDGEILPLKVRRGSETLGVALALKQLI
jgi:C-terminal processing protease CtpA/Prc